MSTAANRLQAFRYRLAAIVLALASIAAAAMAIDSFLAYIAGPDGLWTDANHDRNGHFAAGQQLAIAVSRLDIVGFLDGIERAKSWPPLIDLGLGLTLLLGGIDHTMGVVPGLIAWVACIVLTAVLALRSLADPVEAAVAALLAAALALTSPAFRLLGTDVMFDIPGAALSLGALLAFGRAVEQPQLPARWAALGLLLTCLFLTKYNYWLLCVLALFVTSLTLAPVDRLRAAVSGSAPDGRLVIAAARHPASLLGLTVCIAAGVIFALGPVSVELLGQDVSLYPPNNILTIGYACVLAGVAHTLWKRRAALRDTVPMPVRWLYWWHVVPVAIWLLLPDRITSFLWFIGPTHTGDAAGTYGSIADSVQLYWPTFEGGFHITPWIAWLVAGGFAVSVLLWPRLTVTGRAVLIFALVCLVLVVIHPNRQPRFLSHWLPAVWIAAALATGALLRRVIPDRAAWAAPALAAALSVGFGVYALTRPVGEAAIVAAHQRTDGLGSDLVITRAYLARIDPGAPHAVIASFGRTPLPEWTAREACRCLVRIEQPWAPPDPAGYRAALDAFLAVTGSRTLVVLSVPNYTYAEAYFDVAERHRLIGEAMTAQTRFERVEAVSMPERGGTVSIWRRTE